MLLATNPFERLPLYDQPTLLAYDRPTGPDGAAAGAGGEAPLPPHIFAVANASYRSMMASGDERRPVRPDSDALRQPIRSLYSIDERRPVRSYDGALRQPIRSLYSQRRTSVRP